jgi:hypothetical protein
MGNPSIQKLILRVAGTTGFALFAAFFLLTVSTPQWVEDFARNFITAEVRGRIDTAVAAAGLPTASGALAEVAQELHRRNEEELAGLRRQLAKRSHEQLATALAEVRDPSCECRRAIAAALEANSLGRISALLADNTRLRGFIHGTYMSTVSELKRDIRIFAASNALCFLALLSISFARPRAMRHLFVPGLLLTSAALLCAGLYVFEQDWLLTIIHGSYLGFAYAGYLGIVFLSFCDIVLNRGQVTTTIFNLVAEAVGSAASLVPC